MNLFLFRCSTIESKFHRDFISLLTINWKVSCRKIGQRINRARCRNNQSINFVFSSLNIVGTERDWTMRDSKILTKTKSKSNKKQEKNWILSLFILNIELVERLNVLWIQFRADLNYLVSKIALENSLKRTDHQPSNFNINVGHRNLNL